MKKAILFFVVAQACAAPVYAQATFNPTQTDSNSAMVRIPRSSLPGAGLDGSATSSARSTYPTPIKRDYNPNFVDPTDRNPYLRKH
ncbi:MAG TPA: hypothetical protein PKE16_15970 [Hyphomicrobium sp.]|nr:hypothetical protein [Hyphomicrobium sp.]